MALVGHALQGNIGTVKGIWDLRGKLWEMQRFPYSGKWGLSPVSPVCVSVFPSHIVVIV
jgi:hypothetical protein